MAKKAGCQANVNKFDYVLQRWKCFLIIERLGLFCQLLCHLPKRAISHATIAKRTYDQRWLLFHDAVYSTGGPGWGRGLLTTHLTVAVNSVEGCAPVGLLPTRAVLHTNPLSPLAQTCRQQPCGCRGSCKFIRIKLYIA